MNPTADYPYPQNPSLLYSAMPAADSYPPSKSATPHLAQSEAWKTNSRKTEGWKMSTRSRHTSVMSQQTDYRHSLPIPSEGHKSLPIEPFYMNTPPMHHTSTIPQRHSVATLPMNSNYPYPDNRYPTDTAYPPENTYPPDSMYPQERYGHDMTLYPHDTAGYPDRQPPSQDIYPPTESNINYNRYPPTTHYPPTLSHYPPNNSSSYPLNTSYASLPANTSYTSLSANTNYPPPLPASTNYPPPSNQTPQPPLNSSILRENTKEDSPKDRKDDENKVRQITVQSINKDINVWITVLPTETGISLAEKIHIIATFRTRKITEIITASKRVIPIDNRPVFGSWSDMTNFKNGERWTVTWKENDRSMIDRLLSKVVNANK